MNNGQPTMFDDSNIATRMLLLTEHMILVEAVLKNLVLRLENAGLISIETDEKGWD